MTTIDHEALIEQLRSDYDCKMRRADAADEARAAELEQQVAEIAAAEPHLLLGQGGDQAP